MSPLRICHIGVAERAGAVWQRLERAQRLGFDTVLAAPESSEEIGSVLARACESRGLTLFLDLDAYALDAWHPLVSEYPDCFAVRRPDEWGASVNPHHPLAERNTVHLRDDTNFDPLIGWWTKRLAGWLDAGVRGFRLLNPVGTPERLRTAIMEEAARHACNRVTFIADTTGEQRDKISVLNGFEYTVSSLPWWDGRANWLVEEYEHLSRIAPGLAQVESPLRLAPASSRERCGRLAVALATGTGLLMPLSYADPPVEGDGEVDLGTTIRAANDFVAEGQWIDGRLRKLTSAGSPITVLIRAQGRDFRTAERGLVALINPDTTAAIEVAPDVFGPLGEFNRLEPVSAFSGAGPKLGPAEVRLFRARRLPLIIRSGRSQDRDVSLAMHAPRTVIANVSPSVDGGKYPAKAIVGDTVTVEADIFTDGHPVIAAELRFRAEGGPEWQRARMQSLGNDRWSAPITLERIGRYQFAVEAWIDVYATFARDLLRKRDAGLDLALEVREGQQLLERARASSSGSCAQALAAILRGFEALPDSERATLLIAQESLELMRRADSRPLACQTPVFEIDSERLEARFASWYELFPRSQTTSATRHGTLRDVVSRLPAIREMGFDVLYFPPIHPIGKTNRKGRNNGLTAEDGDVGSVYAIGSGEGGHDCVHPDLGTIDDFRALVSAARDNGLEIALDFAVQASPDHPWLKEHPGWFDWRPDGSIKYAENPPKKYEDIVNVDFYARDAMPELWLALRDIVVFWIAQGVKIFRVDNPHTKPFPFWQWLIADVRGNHPDVLFLSEAFTRPKVMYHLAKIGFSQSYTYFTWRHTKQEFTDYIHELTSQPAAEFYRPHFFVNTPDINPLFLQTSGRAGFLIRAALAGTLSGLWGMYSGFELCEATPLPGREEYLDSEKYEIRPRDWNAPGNIIAEITRLNRIRREEPALRTHLGLTFYNAFNDNVLYFGKAAPGQADRILVAISLDPRHPQEADFEIPLWEWSRADDQSLQCEDLIHGGQWLWHGKMQRMRLTPESPYAIWRVQPPREV